MRRGPSRGGGWLQRICPDRVLPPAIEHRGARLSRRLRLHWAVRGVDAAAAQGLRGQIGSPHADARHRAISHRHRVRQGVGLSVFRAPDVLVLAR